MERKDVYRAFGLPRGSRSSSLEFQVISWQTGDENVKSDNPFLNVKCTAGNNADRRAQQDRKTRCVFVVRAFGVTRTGESISLAIHGVKPQFYIKKDPKWTSQGPGNDVKELVDAVREKSFAWNVCPVQLVNRKDFYGFRNGNTEPFLQFPFHTMRSNRTAVKELSNGIRTKSGKYFPPTDIKLYESNLDPLLRFLHERDIAPAGWIRVGCCEQETYATDGDDEEEEEEEYGTQEYSGDVSDSDNYNRMNSKCTKSYQTHMMYVSALKDCHQSAPAIVMSFDIECDSSHGDFPAAKKGYSRLANQLDELWEMHVNANGQRGTAYEGNKLLRAAVLRAIGMQCDSASQEHPSIDTRVQDTISVLCIKRGLSPHLTKDKLGYLIDDLRSALTSPSTAQKSVLELLDGALPPLEGDPVIQIGCTMGIYGKQQQVLGQLEAARMRHIFVLGGCSDVPGATVHQCRHEQELLLAWAKFVSQVDPDIIVGYNIFTFDMQYMYERAQEIGCADEFMRLLSRLHKDPAKYQTSLISSAGMGDNELKYLNIPGRMPIDVMKVVQREYKLDNYKLDTVAEEFTGEKKHDLSPREIFELYKHGSDQDRARIAAYCVQDCELVLNLTWKLQILANNMGMSNVCSVPLGYIFMRGQSIKVFSLISKHCFNDGFVIPAVKNRYNNAPGTAPQDEDDGYEGAIVLDPVPGIYMEPVTVLDYASLYPSSMISENLSHDSMVLHPEYDNLPDIAYLDIEYDTYTYVSSTPGAAKKKVRDGVKRCRFAQPSDQNGRKKAVIPRILEDLIQQRRTTRKLIELKIVIDLSTGQRHEVFCLPQSSLQFRLRSNGMTLEFKDMHQFEVEDAHDDFQKAVLDGLQLAYKLTANSIYGAIGAPNGQLYCKDIAACTTATGRRLIKQAESYVKENFHARVIYGDTDSIFCIFPPPTQLPDGGDPMELKQSDMIAHSIHMGEQMSRDFQINLKPPHLLEYDKTFCPFILLSKKRYVGNLYETDPTRFVQKSMGSVLKRRDNARIVKHIYGGVVDKILNARDINGSIKFLQESLKTLVRGEYALQDLIISKTLRSQYKNPGSIAHAVLARRMGARDPGNKPNAGQRIPYVYILNPGAQLESDRIEDPDIVRRDGLHIDYRHYIENQIMNPVCQVYGLILERIEGYTKTPRYWDQVRLDLRIKWKNDEDKMLNKLDEQRVKMVQELLFEPFLKGLKQKEKEASLKKEGIQRIDKFFLPVKRARDIVLG